MSKIALTPNASGTGTLTIAAPNTNTDRTLTLPDATGTVVLADASGNVGIGTSSPAAKLEVVGQALFKTGANDLINLLSDSGAIEIVRAAGDAYIDLKNSAGEDYDCRIQSVGTSGNLTFSTTGAERARIDSGGLFLVGTASGFDNVSFLIAQFQGGVATRINSTAATSQMSFFNPNGRVGFISTSGSATTYSTSSDYRLKESVAPMQNALDTVSQLNPVTYTWKADGSAGQGFIAHELQAVVPDCVTGEKDAVDETGNPQYQGVDTSFLVATLVKAIQELTARVAELEAK